MRLRQQYIITKDEVHGYANDWLKKSLRLEYEGTKCTASTLLQVMLIAPSWPAENPSRKARRHQ